MIRSPSLTVGTRPLGLRLRYSGSRLPPNGPPTSRRSKGISSSAQHHSTFWTLDELARPQIFSIDASLAAWKVAIGASVSRRAQPPQRQAPVYDGPVYNGRSPGRVRHA